MDDQQLAVGAGDGEFGAVQIEVAHLGAARVGDCRIASAHLVVCPQAPEVIALERELLDEGRQAWVVVTAATCADARSSTRSPGRRTSGPWPRRRPIMALSMTHAART